MFTIGESNIKSFLTTVALLTVGATLTLFFSKKGRIFSLAEISEPSEPLKCQLVKSSKLSCDSDANGFSKLNSPSSPHAPAEPIAFPNLNGSSNPDTKESLTSGASVEQPAWIWSLSTPNVAAVIGLGAFGVLVAKFFLHGKVTRFWLRKKIRSRVIGVIPARYQSSRFPGKPLVDILGKAMIQRTWEQAKKAKALSSVVIATDSQKIADFCTGFGADVMMTSPECENGTMRCCEVMERVGCQSYDALVNIQGDEPLVEPSAIDAVVLALQEATNAVCSTAVTPLDPLQAFNRNRVKCVVDKRGYALYFSRSLIPSNKEGALNDSFPYLLHLGLMCYDSKFLLQYGKMASTPLQVEEDLEQLRILEEGHKIKVICIDHEAHGVDSPDDVQKIEEILLTKGNN